MSHLVHFADCGVNNGGCDHICSESIKENWCSCRNGYEAPSGDWTKCVGMCIHIYYNVDHRLWTFQTAKSVDAMHMTNTDAIHVRRVKGATLANAEMASRKIQIQSIGA